MNFERIVNEKNFCWDIKAKVMLIGKHGVVAFPSSLFKSDSKCQILLW